MKGMPAMLALMFALPATGCATVRVMLAPPGATLVPPRGPDDPPPPARTVREAVADASDPVLVCEPGDGHGQWECRSASRRRRERAGP
jgi:hypothetical protein